MIIGYRHTGLVVRDIEKSLAFYQDILGFPLWKRTVEKGRYIESVVGISGVVLEWAKLKIPGDTLLELIQYHTHPDNHDIPKIQPSNKIGCSHMAFTVRDIESLYQTLTKRGFHCNSEPQTSPDGLVKVLYCHDPDGIIIEMVEECRE